MRLLAVFSIFLALAAPIWGMSDKSAEPVSQPSCLSTQEGTPILGKPALSAREIYDYVMTRRPGPAFTLELVQEYLDQGKRWGIRADVAIFQAIVETGWFRFEGGTAVTPDDHNYCGLGVTRRGAKGCVFATVADGVSAHLQHLWAYATDRPLPDGWELVDPRFRYVRRGIAPTWQSLGSGAWATSTNYPSLILRLFPAPDPEAESTPTPVPASPAPVAPYTLYD